MNAFFNFTETKVVESPPWKVKIEESTTVNLEELDSPISMKVDFSNSNTKMEFLLSEDKETPITEDDRESIKEETGWSDDIVDALIETKTTKGQYEVYRDADLHECVINDRLCLCKDIDMDYVDEKTGMTNRELMEKGRSPIDSKTGEKIELHHMGQDYNGPLVELNENSEHGDGNHKTLHPKHEDSFRQEPGKEYAYNYEKIQYWKARAAEGSEL